MSPILSPFLFTAQNFNARMSATMRKDYRFIKRKGRNIEVVFAILPDKHISTGTKDMLEAISFAENYLRTQGIYGDTIPLFKNYAKNFFLRTDEGSLRYRHQMFQRENREHWYIRHQQDTDVYVIPYFGEYRLDYITSAMIEKWMMGLKAEHKSAPMTGATKKKILYALREILDSAEREQYISVNPARHVMLPSQKTVNERRALTRYEQQILFPLDALKRVEVWGRYSYAGFFSVMYDTGFRPSEVAGLRVCDIYTTPQGMGVYTEHTICFEEGRAKDRVKTSGKGMESRVGLLSATTEKLIEMLIEKEHLKNEDYLFLVFYDKKESWISSATANKQLRSVCVKMGIDTSCVCQYSLRHTHATYLRGSMEEQALALSMGHSGGRVRNDYDHRTASILIAQLEKHRGDMFSHDAPEEDIKPLDKKMG